MQLDNEQMVLGNNQNMISPDSYEDEHMQGNFMH